MAIRVEIVGIDGKLISGDKVDVDFPDLIRRDRSCGDLTEVDYESKCRTTVKQFISDRWLRRCGKQEKTVGHKPIQVASRISRIVFNEVGNSNATIGVARGYPSVSAVRRKSDSPRTGVRVIVVVYGDEVVSANRRVLFVDR